MSNYQRGEHSADASALGYLFQFRYALLESLRRLRKGQLFVVTLETIDDVTFESHDSVIEVLQTKHHTKKAGNLTDSSEDLWKTLRIWCDHFKSESIPNESLFYLITTSNAAVGSAAYYLKHGESRNPEKAMERLNSVISTSSNKKNQKAYEAFRSLDLDQRKNFLQNIVVFASTPNISILDKELKEVVYGFAPKDLLDEFLVRLEGWWHRRVIKHIEGDEVNPILSNELESITADLREQFKLDNLPIDEEIMEASIDASGYQDECFVHQLKLIDIHNERIILAIKNYYRAFEQRSRWIRDELLFVGDLDKYEDQLIEEWKLHFYQMQDELGERATEFAKKKAAKELYKWIENNTHPTIRPGVTEPSISRGTYQMLSDKQKVGWHIEFMDRLRDLLNKSEVA